MVNWTKSIRLNLFCVLQTIAAGVLLFGAGIILCRLMRPTKPAHEKNFLLLLKTECHAPTIAH